MNDLFDTLYANRFDRDKWTVEPDFDEIFEWESDDPTEADDELVGLDEWLEG